MTGFTAGERDAGLSSRGRTHPHSGVPHQVFNDFPETTKLVRRYDPALPAGELSALPGEEMAS